MDWDKLRVFQAAADAGSFTHAGETLGLSQSADQSAGWGARGRPRRAVVSSPRPRTHSDRARRNAARRSAGRGSQTRRGAQPAHRQPGEAARRIEGHDDAGPRRQLASPAAQRVRRSLPRDQAATCCCRTTTSTSGCAKRTSRYRLREPSQPDLIRRRLVHRAFPRLRLSRLPEESTRSRARSRISISIIWSLSARRPRPICSYDLNSLLSRGPRPQESAHGRRLRSTTWRR